MTERFNFYLGAAASSLSLVLLVIATELSSQFKALIENVFYHHWIAKIVLITLAFILFGFLLRSRETSLGVASEKVGWYTMIGSLIFILIFYIIHFFT